MPKIRMAWGRKSDDRKTHSHGRWIPDNDHNRQVLQDSLAFFQGHEQHKLAEFWLEYRKPRAKRKSDGHLSPDELKTLPWWQASASESTSAP
ncbi:hypothetical protein WAE61_05985 [Comamonadaceae bacterium PP-2]